MKNFHKNDLVKLARTGNEPAEFKLGQKGVLVCGECDSYYFKKGWHAGAGKFLNKRENRELSSRKTLCPADLMIKHRVWEGKVIIQNPPKEKLSQLKNLIRNFGKDSQTKDTLDRIIGVEEGKSSLFVTTTENQMAHKLAKKIRDAFKKISLKIYYQKAPGDAEVAVVKFG